MKKADANKVLCALDFGLLILSVSKLIILIKDRKAEAEE